MTPPTPTEIARIVGSLTEAQRRAIRKKWVERALGQWHPGDEA
jgi:hypothetical protein